MELGPAVSVVLQNKRNLMGTMPFHEVLALPSCFDSVAARHLDTRMSIWTTSYASTLVLQVQSLCS